MALTVVGALVVFEAWADLSEMSMMTWETLLLPFFAIFATFYFACEGPSRSQLIVNSLETD